MADLETQIRSLADRRFASTRPVELSLDGTHAATRPSVEDASAPSIDGTEMRMHSNENVRPRRRWYLAGAAAGLVAITVLGVALTTGDSDDQAASPPEDVPAPTPTMADFGADGALARVDDYFAAHEAGDIDAVFALFTSDATFSDTWTSPIDRAGWEPRFAWDMAQGERLISPECEVIDERPGVSVSISCEYGTLDALGVAVDAPQIPTTVTVMITPDGIHTLREDYGQPNFTLTGNQFSRWMDEHHPDDADDAGCCGGQTVEESVARGELRARYANEWAAHLEANDCDWHSTSC